MIKRPMKAPSESITDDGIRKLIKKYGVLAVSPKLDGIRAETTGEIVLSNTLKPIGNKFIQKCLKGEDYEGFDGELIVGSPFLLSEDDDVFNRTTGPVRRADGEPDFKFYVFDDWRWVKDSYDKRWVQQIKECPEIHDIPYIVVIEQRLCYTAEEVIACAAEFDEMGYEGAMIRTLTKGYKEGRCTANEECIFKRTSKEDDDCLILDCFEQMENQNEQTKDALGLSRRSAHKDNKVGKDTLGGFVCLSKRFEKPFNMGTFKGGTDEWRKRIWEQFKKDPDSIKGQYFKYVYKRIGSLEKPRQPIGKGFRDPNDMTDF